MTDQPSRFITFEGIDRCGKTTQAKLLKRNLGQLGIRCLVTAEPGGSGTLGNTLRDVLLNPDISRHEVTASLLFSADRYEHVKNIIVPTLEKGIWVISDRFADSTIAYQGAGGNVDMELLRYLTEVATQGTKPDLTILLQLDSEKRTKRNPKLDYYDQGRTSFELRVSSCFAKLAQEEPERFLVIDSSLPIAEVAELIMTAIKKRFELTA